MLQSIPRVSEHASHRISAKELHEKLLEKNLNVDIRSVQRDLHELATLLPDLKNDGNKYSIGWYWAKDSKIQQIPAIDPALALTFKLVDQFLSELVPKSVKDILQPYFDSSDDVLNALGTDKLSSWSDKVRILPRTQALIPATINDKILVIIYQGLFEGKQINATYRRSDEKIREYLLNPLGLVFRETSIYLVATVKTYIDPFHFALHRFIDCELLEQEAKTPETFELDEYISSGSFDYANVENKYIKLIAIFEPIAANHLNESPLSKDQVIVKKRDGRIQITATVKDSRQLKWWLLGFGDSVEVIKPKKLRNEFIGIAESLVKLYSE